MMLTNMTINQLKEELEMNQPRGEPRKKLIIQKITQMLVMKRIQLQDLMVLVMIVI